MCECVRIAHNVRVIARDVIASTSRESFYAGVIVGACEISQMDNVRSMVQIMRVCRV